MDTPSGVTRVPGLSAFRWHWISRALFLAGVTLVAAGVPVVVAGFASDGAAVRIVGILIALAGVTLISASWSPVFPYFRRVGEELEAGYTTMDRGFEWSPGSTPAQASRFGRASPARPTGDRRVLTSGE